MKSTLSTDPILAVILLITAVTACRPQDSESGNHPLRIVDVTGHTVQLEELPVEIAIAGRASVMVQDAAFIFEEAPQRVKALENRNQSVYDFLSVVDPDLARKDLFAMDAGPEQVAAVKPDLVLMKNFNRHRLGASIEELGIPVLYLDLETPEAFYRDLEVLGQVFGNPRRAEEIIRFYQRRMEKVDRISSSGGEGGRPRVLLLRHSLRGAESAFSIPPASWLQTEMVTTAGGQAVWKESGEGGGWTVVNFEQIAAWNPDQIYIIDYQGDASYVVERIKADPLWSDLAAVQNDQLYAFAFDYYSWDQPDPRWILGLEWLATKIHPQQAAQLDVLAEVNLFYSTLYRLDPKTIQEEVLPKLRGDIP